MKITVSNAPLQTLPPAGAFCYVERSRCAGRRGGRPPTHRAPPGGGGAARGGPPFPVVPGLEKVAMSPDPYASCPCGSGKKFKWCCQPIHAEIEKAFRQQENGQHEAALLTIRSE